jgi:hypothetical protein
VRDVATAERHATNLERRHTIMVCESPQVFPPALGGTVLLNVDATENKSHESRGKLRRSTPVSKSRACVNDARQKRLSLPLHGINEEECVDGNSLHDPACGFHSVSEESEVFEEYVFDRSKGLRMPVTRSHYQSLSRSATITEAVSTSQTVSKSKSSSNVKEKPRPMVRSRSSVDVKPAVLVRARNIPRSQSSDEGHVTKTDSNEQRSDTTEGGGVSSRPRPKPAPRKSLTRTSPVLPRQRVESETKEVNSNSSKSHVISESDNSEVVSKRHSSASEVKVRRTSSESQSSVEGDNSGHRIRRSSRHGDKSPRQQVPDRPREEEAVIKQQRESSPSRRHRDSSSPSRRHRDSSSPSRRHRDSTSPSRRHRDSSSPSRRHRDSTSPSRQHRDSTSPSRQHRDSSPSRRHRDSSSPSRRHRDSSSPSRHEESHHSKDSPRRRRREGRDESGQSEAVKHDEPSHHIHRHRLSSQEEMKSESEKFLRQSKERVPLRRSARVSEDKSDSSVTLNRKSSLDDKQSGDSESPKLELKSNSSPKPEVKLRLSRQSSKSGGDDSPVQNSIVSPRRGEGESPVQRPVVSPVLSSAEPVQRRSRPQAVGRSHSHKNFYRHSTDFSGSSAIVPEGSPSSSPAGHGIMLGRYRREAEELLKPVHQEEDVNSGIPERVEDGESPERLPTKWSELNVSELLHVSGSPEFGAESTNGVPSSSSPDSDSAVSILMLAIDNHSPGNTNSSLCRS